MIDIDNVAIVIEDRNIPRSFAAADIISAITIRSSPISVHPSFRGGTNDGLLDPASNVTTSIICRRSINNSCHGTIGTMGSTTLQLDVRTTLGMSTTEAHHAEYVRASNSHIALPVT